MLVITMSWGCIHDTSKASTCSQEHRLRTLENVLPCPYHMDWPLSCSWACDGICAILCAILCALYRWLRQALFLSRACFSFSLGMAWQFWCWKKCYQCCVLYSSCINLGPQLPLRHDMRNMWAHVSLQNSDPDNMAADKGTRSQQKAAEPPSAKCCKLRIFHGDEPLTLVILGHPGTIAQPSMKALFQWLVGSFNPWRIPEISLKKHGKGSHRWPLKTAWVMRDALRRSTTMPPGCTLARWAVLSMSSLGSLLRFWAELRGWNWCWLRIDWAILRGYFSCHFSLDCQYSFNIRAASMADKAAPHMGPADTKYWWFQSGWTISLQYQSISSVSSNRGKKYQKMENVIVEKEQYNTIHHTSPYSIRSHQQQSDKLANVGAMPPSCVPETEGDGINHYGAHWPPPTLATTRSSQNPKWNLGWSL